MKVVIKNDSEAKWFYDAMVNAPDPPKGMELEIHNESTGPILFPSLDPTTFCGKGIPMNINLEDYLK